MKNQRNISEKNDWTSMWVRRTLVCALIFALTVTLAPVQTLAQTIGQQKNLADLLPETAVYPVRDCTVTYDTILQEDSSAAVRIEIANHGERSVSQWQLRFYYPYIINLSGDIQITSHENGYYTYIPQQSLREIPSGQTINFSFTVSGAAIPEPPETVELVINGEQFAPLPTATPMPTATAAVQTASPNPAGTSADTPVAPMAMSEQTPETSIEYETSVIQSTSVENWQPTTQPIIESTATPDTEPSIELSATPDVEPSAIPDTQPTATPEPSVTPLPSPAATAQPTTEPTPQPEETAEPTAEPAQDLYIYTDTTISEDITCGNLFLMGGSLNINGHTVTVQGDYFQNGGNCSLYRANIKVGENLTITQGTFNIDRQGKAEIQGDFQIEGSGKLTMTENIDRPQLIVHGDIIINSTEQSLLQYGILTLSGDLIQKDSGYADSLCASNSFRIQFLGSTVQKIRLANPEVKLGELDFQESAGVDIPEEIHANTLYGFRNIQANEIQKFYLDSASLREDDTVHSKNAHWCSGTLYTGTYTMNFAGNVEISGNSTINTTWGRLSVAGNVSVTKGTLYLSRESSVEIQGDLWTEGNGKLTMTEYINSPQLTVHGDIIINSTEQSYLEYGILTLSGDLIQKDSGYADSLRVSDIFQLQFQGSAIQKIRLANPEVKLGTMDFRQGAGIDIPEEIHARTLYGFHNIQANEIQKFYLDSASLREDDTVHSKNAHWCSGTLYTGIYTMNFAGNVEISGNSTINTTWGKLSVAGDVSVTKGTLYLSRESSVEIQGDLRTEGSGKLTMTENIDRPKLTVHGNIIINSTEQSFLQYGTLTLSGNLIQKDSGYADSLRVSDIFQMQFQGSAVQKIRLANLEVKFGSMDFRQSAGVDIPEEIHAYTLYGFHKIQANETQKFYLYSASLTEDDTVYSKNVQWCSGTLYTGIYTMNFVGNVEISGNSTINTIWGKLSVAGNMTVTEGALYLSRESSVEIQGDLHIEGSGKLTMTENIDRPQLTVHGNIIINSMEQSFLQYGTLTLSGDLIQKDSGYADSLRVSDIFQMQFQGSAVQKIRLANLEVKFGSMDFRKSAGVDIPEEIHAQTLYGFRKIQANENQKFYLDSVKLNEDDIVHSKNVQWCSGTLYTGIYTLNFAGNVEISGNSTINTTWGRLSVAGNMSVTEGTLYLSRESSVEIQGDLRMKGSGKLTMTENIDRPELTVHGDIIINSTEQSRLEYGTLTLGGSFLQKEANETENLRIGGSFTLVLNGKDIQIIDLPGVKEIYYLDLSRSKSVRLDSEISGYTLNGIEKLLCPDGTLYVDFDYARTSSSGTIHGNLKCFGNLDISGHTLTVQGKYTQYQDTDVTSGGSLTITGDFTADKGRTTIRDGLIHVKGTTHIKKDAIITMFGGNSSRFLAEGDYISACRNVDVEFFYPDQSGIFEVKGNLIQRETAINFGIYLAKTMVLFSGESVQKVQMRDFSRFGYVACIDLRKSQSVDFGNSILHAGQIIGFSHIRADEELVLYDSRITLIQDETFEGNITFDDCYLNLNGHCFHIREHGNLEQCGGLINLSEGKLHVGGSYHMTGDSILQMIRHSDLLQVKGNFSTASTMSHGDMLCDGRMELWGNFNQSGAEASFGSSRDFTIAFLGSGQKAHFDDIIYSGFANIDPEYGSVTMDDEPLIFMARLSYHLAKGFLCGLQDSLGEFGEAAMGITTILGITITAVTILSPVSIAAEMATILGILTILSNAFMIARAAGGIYSTATGNETSYEKAEAFAYDTAIMMVAILSIIDTADTLSEISSLCKNAAERTAKSNERIKPSEIINQLEDDIIINSFDDFIAFIVNYVTEEATKYICTLLRDGTDDIASLMQIAQLIKDGFECTEEILTKDELQVAVETLWEESDMEKALEAIVDCFNRGGKFISETDRLRINAWKNTPSDELYLKYKDVFDNPKYYNQKTGDIHLPKNDGFLAETRVDNMLIPKGTIFKVFGDSTGTFLGNTKDSFESRALAPSGNSAEVHYYELAKDCEMTTGKTAPWFGSEGGAERFVKYKSDGGMYTIDELLRDNFLVDITDLVKQGEINID